jgi:pimeloyl-ACP methyl ester carboxylesterase
MSAVWRSADGEAQVKALYRRFLDHWPVPREELRVPTRQGETFLVACGPADGPALLLFHGSAFNSVSWMGDVSAWSRHFRVYAVDMIGEPGFSAPSRPPLASDAYARWLDDVMAGLGLKRAALAGISLGGWLALDYATRRPERVTKLAVIAPGGLARNRNIALWAIPMALMGRWGRGKLLEKIAGPIAANPPPALKAVMKLQSAIFSAFKPRVEKLPIFTRDELRRLTMPVLAILGGRDVMIDSAAARTRLEFCVPHAHVCWLPEAHHAILGQTDLILDFLRDA